MRTSQPTDDGLSLKDFMRQPLMDNFGRKHNYLRISLTERCNLRCTYCMPPDGVDLTPKQELLTTEEIIRVSKHFVQSGVTKIRFTGGEPLLRQDLAEIISEVNKFRSIGLTTVSITTNGITLREKKLRALMDAGLNAVNISLDTLDRFKFHLITRRNGMDKVMKAIEQAEVMSREYPHMSRVKVNCVVTRKVNDDEMVDFVKLTENRDIEVRFIEYMPFDGNSWDDNKMVPFREMKTEIRKTFPTLQRVQDAPSEVSKTYQVPGFKGRVGFITSMSEHFCGDCNRLRITADGNLKVCLFGANEISLRDVIRDGADDEQLSDVVSQALGRKKARHAGMFEIAKMKNRPMTTIGG